MIMKELYDELRAKGVDVVTIPINKLPVRGAFSDWGEMIALKAAIEIKIRGTADNVRARNKKSARQIQRQGPNKPQRRTRKRQDQPKITTNSND